MSAITYEQPLNERIRTFLRLEFLFAQVDQTLYGHTEWDSRAALTGIIEIINIFTRADLKTEIIKELERLAAALSRLEENPAVDQAKLGQILDEMDSLIDRIHATQGQIGQALREHELITNVRQRSTIPGGTCGFDLPAYHYWLQRPAGERIDGLRQWLSAFDEIRAAVGIILRIVRDSAAVSTVTAAQGFYQQALDANTPFQLIRVSVPPECGCFAEISGGKHRFTIRFMEFRAHERPAQTAADVQFQLGCCAI